MPMRSIALDRSVVPSPPLRVGLVGVGPVGREIARALSRKPWARLVAAVDVDPELQGQSLAKLAGLEEDPGVKVAGSLEGGVDVVAHATVSELERVAPQLTDLLESGVSVVSTCEELSFPLDPAPARGLDRAARVGGATLMGTGINPGFLLDVLPAGLTVACQEVRRVRAVRVVDAAERRGPLQEKIGAGLDPAEWRRRRDLGEIRHVGLPESARLLAAAVGWDDVEFDPESIEPVLADRTLTTEFLEVDADQAAGVRQRIVGSRGGREVLELELAMYVGAPEPHDAVSIDGVPPIEMVIEGGVHGDRATAGVVANMLPRVAVAEPGLCTMADLPTGAVLQETDRSPRA